MARILFASALALGATLATGGFSTADEPAKSSFGGGFGGTTMTLGGTGTAAAAAASTDDTEEACCRRRFCGYGYRGGYYGGYSSYYGGFGGYGGYGYSSYYSYRPFYRSFAYRPFYRPYYGGYSSYYGGYGYGGGFGSGIYIGINGTKDDATAPVMTLGLASARNPLVAPPSRSNDLREEPGTFRYDGGPANPVPQVKPDAEPRTQAAPAATGLPVSLKKEPKPASPYRYKAYGEK
jgi:hypothetical protein